MDELKRLVRLVTEGTIKPLPLILPEDEISLESRLFYLIQNNEVKNDEEAAAALYNAPHLSPNYRMLKSRLRKKLLNNLYFIDATAKGDGLCRQEILICNSMLHQAHNLLYSGETKIAFKLLDQILGIAKPVELSSIVVQVLVLQLDIHLHMHNKKLFYECSDELAMYQQLENKEREASVLFKKTKLELNSGVSAISKSLPFVPMVLQRLDALWQETNLSRIYNYYHLLRIGYLEYTGNFEGIACAIQEAEELVQKGILNPKWFNSQFNNFILVYAMLRTHQLERGLQLAEEHIKSFETSVNWYGIMDTYLLLAFYSRRYTLALELTKKVADRKGTEKPTSNQSERWELNRRFLLLMCKLMPAEVQEQSKRISAFTSLNEMPKDKEGFNLPLLILEFIDDLDNYRLDDFEKHSERLRKYTIKYLRGERAERARLFLRLLLLVTKESLNYNSVKSKGQSLFEKLKHTPPPNDAFAEVEIVPYEQLWELVLHLLEQRSQSRKH
jgi:hypothetical protein